jgi:hypothetical protein
MTKGHTPYCKKKQKKTNYKQYLLTWCCFPYVHFCEWCLSCVYCLMCNCCISCVGGTYVYLLYFMCICWPLILDAGLLARSQYPEGPATGYLDTGFSWFPCVYKRML